MYSKLIGVSILTNGDRLTKLQACVESFLLNCYYRPLAIAVFDNGSTDRTAEWLAILEKTKVYGVEWRIARSEKDLGCARGTNWACGMVKDCEFAVHLESDFEHLTPEESGEDKMWLRRAVEFLNGRDGNYMYLRRIADEHEMMAHWWSQWMWKIELRTGRYLSCPNFWWSNNPSLYRNGALYGAGTLPLDESKDGPKGSGQWSKPELEAKLPGRAWIHQWGMFVHERQDRGLFALAGCGSSDLGFGVSRCKYGFFKDGTEAFCRACRRELGIEDMPDHEQRFRNMR